MYNEIQEMINDLKIDFIEHLDLLNELHNQMHTAFSCAWEAEELESHIKGDEDVLNNIDQDCGFYEEVRNIQDIIIKSNTIGFES